jgi:hypothetical protein
MSRDSHDLGHGVGLLAVVYRGRPLRSSEFLEPSVEDMVVWEDSVIRRMTTHTDIDEAPAAAGRLAEAPGH